MNHHNASRSSEQPQSGPAEGHASRERRERALPDEARGVLLPPAPASGVAPIIVPAAMPTPPAERLPLVPVELDAWETPTVPPLSDTPEQDTLVGPPPRDPRVGATVGAGYLVHERVGQGGTGCVYRAEQARLGRDVAVKFLHPHLLGDERSLAQFYIEARAASRLTHPNSVTIIDFGLDPGGTPYLVMEFLQGQHLRSLLNKSGALPPRTAIRVALEVLSVLGEAHARGVVHRDLKPENIFLVPRREGGHHVKVVDFGLVRLSETSSLSQYGWIGGTPVYTAPERWVGDEVDGRADLYALGVVLFEMLTGRPPFTGDIPRLLLAHLSEPPPLPSSVAPGQRLSPVLDEVVRQALEKRPQDRFPSAEAMAGALSDALEGLGHSARAVRCGSCSARIPFGEHSCSGCGALRFTLSPPRPTWHPPSSHDTDLSPLGQLLALEQQARSADRSDLNGVIHACQQGCTVARKAHMTTGDDLFEHALISFSTKLGEALVRAGRLAEAEGVLRETLTYAAVEPAQRARMLLLLGRASAGRGSRGRAEACYLEAIGLLSHHPDPSLAADAYEAHAALCRDNGARGEAVRSLQAACDALAHLPDAGARRVGALLSLGSLLVEAGQSRRALGVLRDAFTIATAEGLSSLASTCWHMLDAMHSRLDALPPPSSGARRKRPPTDLPRPPQDLSTRAALTGSDAPRR